MEKNTAYYYDKQWFPTLVELTAVEDIEQYDYILMPDGCFLCVDDIEKEFRDGDIEDETDENTVYTIYNLPSELQKSKRFRQKSKQFPFGLHKLSTAERISNIPPKSKFLVMRNLTFS